MKIAANILFLLVFIVLINNKLEGNTYYPQGNINVHEKPSAGYIFIGSYSITAGLYDTYGTAPDTLQKGWKNLSKGADFKLHKNGIITFFDHFAEKFYGLDKNFNKVDSFQTINYPTDFHDIQFASNGNVLLIGIDERTMDLSQKVVNGKTNAKVKGFVLQEINSQKQVVWQWSTFDNFEVTDAVDGIDLTGLSVSFCHINTAIYDTDGNIIISSRFLDEITKINRQTGAIIWRLGGQKSKKNQFTFQNDSDENGYLGFTHQHTPTRLKNGNLMLFDNGNQKTTQYSRAVEYEINEVTKVAKKVWEYRLNPDHFTAQMGSVQELDNGNIFISWGRRFTEVTKSKVLLFDMEFGSDLSYRGYKYIFDMDAMSQTVNSTKNYIFNNSNFTTGVELNIDTLSGSGQVWVQKHKYFPPYAQFAGTFPTLLNARYVIQKSDTISNFKANLRIDTRTIPNYKLSDSVKIYYRVKEGHNQFNILTTKYGTNIIEARIPGEGEFVLGFVPPLQVPNIVSPKNNTIGNAYSSLNLSWSVVSLANKYQVQIAKDNSFTNLVKDTTINTTNNLKLDLEPFTNYFYRVKSKTNSEESDWSAITQFQTLIATPQNQTPEINKANLKISDNLTWSEVNGANKYQVQISKNINFAQANIIKDTILNTNTYSFNKLDFGTKYFWRVKAYRDTTSTDYNSIFNFTTKLESVDLVSPINNEKFFDISNEFKWEVKVKDLVYQIQIAEDSAFTKITIDQNNVANNVFKVGKLLFNKDYYWRVRSINGDLQSDWSETFQFRTKIDKALLIRPNNNQTNIDLTTRLTWERILGANQYKVQLSKSNQFNEMLLDTTVENTGSLEQIIEINNLEYETNYFWRVRGINEFGNSDFSNIFSFTTRNKFTTPTPNLIRPNNNLTSTNPKVDFEWTQLSGVLSYQIQLSADNNFSNIYIDSIFSENKITFDNFEFDKRYFWRVRANGLELPSNWSNVRNFIIREEGTILPKPTLVSPVNLSNNIEIKPNLQWDNSNNFEKFNIIISKDINFDADNIEFNNVIGSNINLNEGSVALEYETKYYWKIQGIANEKESEFSDVWQFTTISDPGTSIQSEMENTLDELFPFPNPSNNIITINIDTNNENLVQFSAISIKDVDLYDTNGNEYTLPFEISNKSIIINIQNLPNSTYFIRLTEFGIKNVIKFVKN